MPASLKINRNKRSQYTNTMLIMLGAWNPAGTGKGSDQVEIHVPMPLWAQEWTKMTDAKMPGRPPKELLDLFQDRITADVDNGNSPEGGVFTLRG